jgi:hypothetical protein
MDFGDFLEGELILGAEIWPGVEAMGVEIVLTEVLEPDAEAGGIVVKDGGDVDAEFGEAVGGGCKFGVV